MAEKEKFFVSVGGGVSGYGFDWYAHTEIKVCRLHELSGDVLAWAVNAQPGDWFGNGGDGMYDSGGVIFCTTDPGPPKTI